MSTEALIEAILFYKAEPVSKKMLERALNVTSETLTEALGRLHSRLAERGIRLQEKDDAVMLVTAPEAADVITHISQKELTRDIGDAGLETLAIVLYRGPVSKADIDYIRGVDSGSILRNLLVRGLVEKKAHPERKRVTLYRPTFALLSHLGITSIEELPEYDTLQREIAAFYSGEENADTSHAAPSGLQDTSSGGGAHEKSEEKGAGEDAPHNT